MFQTTKQIKMDDNWGYPYDLGNRYLTIASSSKPSCVLKPGQLFLTTAFNNSDLSR